MGLTLPAMALARPLEREADLHQLTELLGTASRGRGQVCVIEGPSGVGKTRLLDECYEMSRSLGMDAVRARGSELTRDYPFGVARTLFEARLIRAAPALRTVLMRGPAVLAEPVFGHGEATEEFGVIHGLYWLTVNFAEYSPMAILIDDVHWADDFTLRFLAYIAERIEDIAVALVVVIRTGDPFAESQLVTHLWDAASTAPIRPTELSERAVQTLLADALQDREVDATLARAVVRDTGGNPLFVVAVADAIGAGVDTEIHTPESVRRHIILRMARLNHAASSLAKAASVLGDDAELRHAIRLADMDADGGLVAAQNLLETEVFATADPVVFTHRITRMAIYSMLEPGERLALHKRAAELLAAGRQEPEAVAEHLLHAGPTDEAWALAALHEAGRAAARKGAPAAAMRYLRRAVESADVSRLPARVLIDLGLAEAAAGEQTSLDRFEQALDLVSHPDERAEALYSLGQTLYRFGHYAEAGVTFRRGATLFEGGDRQTRLRFEGAACGAEYHLTPAQRGPSITIDDRDADGPGGRAVLAFQALRDALTQPPAHKAGELAERALGEGALLAEQTSDGPSVNLATLALLHAGRVVEAHRAAEATIRDARERGGLLAYAEASLVRSLVLLVRGHITDAAADAQVAWDGMRSRSHVQAHTALATLAHCMVERDELDQAAALFRQEWEEVPTRDAPAIDAYVYTTRGLLHLRRRDLDAARCDLDAAENAMRPYGAINPAASSWRSLAGIAAHLSGDEQRAHELFDEEIRLAELFDVPICLGIALRRKAVSQSPDQARNTLEEAVRILENTEATLELARSHGELGRVLRRSGERVLAREHLGIGLDLAYRCCAIGLEAEIRKELTAAGARPRRTAVTGIESLTPTELRVAQLAAGGLSNRELAEQIFVSSNTIAWHLHNVYRKLAIESREQLRPLLDD